MQHKTFFKLNYLLFLHYLRHGMPMKVPEEIELLIDDSVEKIKCDLRETMHLKSFIVSGFDLKTVGKLEISFYG